eukprot:6216632-Pyramimonas_sp.AAC.1
MAVVSAPCREDAAVVRARQPFDQVTVVPHRCQELEHLEHLAILTLAERALPYRVQLIHVRPRHFVHLQKAGSPVSADAGLHKGRSN